MAGRCGARTLAWVTEPVPSRETRVGVACPAAKITPFSEGAVMQKKLSLSPEALRVDSFSTETLGAGRVGTVQGHITTKPYTCPECANPG